MLQWIKKTWNSLPNFSNTANCTMIYNKPWVTENILKETLKNPVAMACINYLSRSIHTFIIKSYGYKFHHKWYNLLENIVIEYLFHGNCFLQWNEKSNHLEILKTSLITIDNNKIFYKNQWIKNYIHIKNYNIFQNDWGLCPLETVFSHILQYNTINNYLNNIAGRGGVTSGIIFSKNILNNQTRQQIQNEIKDFYRNVNSQGTIMVLEGDFSWSSIAVSPQDLDIKKMNNYNGSAIARGLGVHPVLIGLDKRSYGGLQYLEVRKQFIDDTLIPLYEKITDQIQEQLLWKYNIQWNMQLLKKNNIKE